MHVVSDTGVISEKFSSSNYNFTYNLTDYHHISLTYNKSTSKATILHNGAVKSEVTTSNYVRNTNAPFIAGKNLFNSTIIDMRYYDNGLTTADILGVYSSQKLTGTETLQLRLHSNLLEKSNDFYSKNYYFAKTQQNNYSLADINTNYIGDFNYTNPLAMPSSFHDDVFDDASVAMVVQINFSYYLRSTNIDITPIYYQRGFGNKFVEKTRFYSTLENDVTILDVSYNVAIPEYPTSSFTVDITARHPVQTSIFLRETYDVIVSDNHNVTSTSSESLVFLQTGQTLSSANAVNVNTSIFDDTLSRTFSSVNYNTLTSTQTYTDVSNVINKVRPAYDVSNVYTEWIQSIAVEKDVPIYPASFDGTNYLQLPYTNILNKPQFTITIWVYGTSNNGNNQFILYSQNGNYKGYSLARRSNNKWGFLLGRSGQWSYTNSENTVVDNTWYHLAVTYDRTNIKLYVNGELEDSEGNTQYPSHLNIQQPLYIGSNIGNDGFVGHIFDFRYYETVLPINEIYNIYTGIHNNNSIIIYPNYHLALNREAYMEIPVEAIRNKSHNIDLKHSILFNYNSYADKTGNSTVTLHNNPLVNGNGLNLVRASSQYADLGTTNIGGPLTFAVWVNVNDTSQQWQRIINFETNSNTERLVLLQSGSSPEFRTQIFHGTTNQSTSDSGGGVNFSTNTWYHIVWVMEPASSTIKLYLNGK